MAHFAELSKANIVLRVVIVNNTETMKDSIIVSNPELLASIKTTSGKRTKDTIIEWEDEAKGIALCSNLLGGKWVQTSYNGNTRKQYAGIGYTYDVEHDVFIAPQPYPSWTLDDLFTWQAPIAIPDDGKAYLWDEKAGAWIEMVEVQEVKT